MGVYQAAKDAGKLAIGVDSNQNHLHPGTMLTSMLKRVDVAVYNVSKNHKPGMSVLGLKEDGVGYALGVKPEMYAGFTSPIPANNNVKKAAPKKQNTKK